jgi:hypothetical protein
MWGAARNALWKLTVTRSPTCMLPPLFIRLYVGIGDRRTAPLSCPDSKLLAQLGSKDDERFESQMLKTYGDDMTMDKHVSHTVHYAGPVPYTVQHITHLSVLIV